MKDAAIAGVAVSFFVGLFCLVWWSETRPAAKAAHYEDCLRRCAEKAMDAPNADAADFFCAVRLCGLDAGVRSAATHAPPE